MVWLSKPQRLWVTQSQFWCFWRDQTCEPPVMQLISNHPVALPYARFSIYMFTNPSISSTLDLFMPLELVDTFSLDIWYLEIITSWLITPRNVIACYSISAPVYVCLHVIVNHVCVCLCVCVCVCVSVSVSVCVCVTQADPPLSSLPLINCGVAMATTPHRRGGSVAFFLGYIQSP